MPHFVTQRSLYEIRERPAKTYSWVVFVMSNITVELPWNMLAGTILFFTWYYPIGLYRNAEPANQVHERGGLMYLLVVEFLLFTSTFAHMMISAMDTAETAGNMGNLLFSLSLIFCGALASPSALPRFWIFMYRVSPFTYFVEALLAVGIANTNVVCATNELLHFNPPSGQTCGDYMAAYVAEAGGYIANPGATTACDFCAISSTNTFLAGVASSYSHRWRDFGIIFGYIAFNVFAAVTLYWLVRVPKKAKAPKAEKAKKEA